jgi:prevent-host-death family protein
MTTTILSSREFNQNSSGAKKAAEKGPVIITDRGKPAHVLLSFEQYQELSGKKKSIVELLSMPGMEDIEFDPPRLGAELVRPADFSE